MIGEVPPGLGSLEGAVHVWVGDVRLAPDDLSALERVLADDERERARRFRFTRDRRTYVVAHWLVRHVLSRYLDVAPTALRFATNPYGKPELEGGDDLRFNLSHSRDVVTVAVAHRREVGIDVEQVRSELATAEIARRFFAPTEVAALDRLEGMEYVRAFFACWTRKEAYIKAVGLGLSLGLDTFAVSIAPREAARLLSADGGPREVARWELHSLELVRDYAAALAVEGRAVRPTITYCRSFAGLT
jgi:4'-phosphopantetheinyl transferase